MASWIPGNHSMAARIASILPSDIKTLSQLMNDVKYASLDVDGDGKTHVTGEGKSTESDKKQLILRVGKMIGDYKKANTGATEDDFKKALSAGSLPVAKAGGLSSAQQQDLFSMMFTNDMFSDEMFSSLGLGTGSGGGV